MGSKVENDAGLFEFLESSVNISYDADHYYYTDDLTEEEEARFAKAQGSKEEVEESIRVYKALRGKRKVSGIDALINMINDIWFDRKELTKRDRAVGSSASS